jgi:hypothetical protein
VAGSITSSVDRFASTRRCKGRSTVAKQAEKGGRHKKRGRNSRGRTGIWQVTHLVAASAFCVEQLQIHTVASSLARFA